jgi:two-component system sensor histidine kinase BaeS
MRSFAARLTVAFLIVGIASAMLVTLIVSQQTRMEFNRFVTDQTHDEVAHLLGEQYALIGYWAFPPSLWQEEKQLAIHADRITVVDNEQRVVYSPEGRQNGQMVEAEALEAGMAIEASALFAAVLALVLGLVLSRSLTRPLQALTAATEAMAAGNLGEQVPVTESGEIGLLTTSFNRMSADLAKASQLRKQMTADIAHDLRTPLSVLGGYAEGLMDGTLKGSPRLFGLMHEEVNHLQHLVEDLRMLSLADAGELRLNRRPVDPRALLERTGLAYVMQAEQQGVALRIEAAEDLPSVAVDLERMTQVLNNLVVNALRHTPAGEIVLSAHQAGAGIELVVQDSGHGIDAEDLPHIFDRFYRADKARERGVEDEGGSSTGLGLAIARAIVAAHGGAIRAESTLGQGSRFVVTVPTATPA